MWPFDRKEKEQQKIWDVLSGKVDYDKMLEDAMSLIRNGKPEKGSALLQNYIDHKIDKIAKQVLEDDSA